MKKRPRAIVVMGASASGKTCYALSSRFAGFEYIHNTPTSYQRGYITGLMDEGKSFIVDAVNATRADRSFYIDLVKGNVQQTPHPEYSLECHYLRTSMVSAQENAKRREKMGGIRFNKAHWVKSYIAWRKGHQEPSQDEGFDLVVDIPFALIGKDIPSLCKAVFFSLPSVCVSISGSKYPRSPKDLKVLSEISTVFDRYSKDGYKLIGVAHLPVIAMRLMHEDIAQECIIEVLKQIKPVVDDVFYGPHRTGRKKGWDMPSPYFAHCARDKHGINLEQSIMVGSTDIDKRFAESAGFASYLPVHLVKRAGSRRVKGYDPLANVKQQFS